MSLTSYRAAPPRAGVRGLRLEGRAPFIPLHEAVARRPFARKVCEWVFGVNTSASMPGGDLLFQRLSVSTIGAVRFHGRVRDGIGWDTDAMATRQWSRRVRCTDRMPCTQIDAFVSDAFWLVSSGQCHALHRAGLSLMVGLCGSL